MAATMALAMSLIEVVVFMVSIATMAAIGPMPAKRTMAALAVVSVTALIQSPPEFINDVTFPVLKLIEMFEVFICCWGCNNIQF